MLKSSVRILSLQALLRFPIPTQNPFGSTEMKVISPIYLAPTLCPPQSPYEKALFIALIFEDWDLHVLPSPGFPTLGCMFPKVRGKFL